jgi:cob(I)alamin adenosyltransferase
MSTGMKADIQLQHRRMAESNPGSVQGLVVVFTGTGKGKSGAAFNLAWRAIAHKTKVGVVQFFGGSPHHADYQLLSKNPLCDFQIFGNECTWRAEDHRHDTGVVNAAWQEAVRMIGDVNYGMVILDDLPLMLKHQYLHPDQVMVVLRQRRAGLHVVIAGRYAPFVLIDYADIVTEMRSLKYPTPDRDIPAQAGIEF